MCASAVNRTFLGRFLSFSTRTPKLLDAMLLQPFHRAAPHINKYGNKNHVEITKTQNTGSRIYTPVLAIICLSSKTLALLNSVSIRFE